MGNSESKKQEYIAEQRNLQEAARRKYHLRIKSYSPDKGPYDFYVVNCQAQYELDCIPERCQQGSYRKR
jgi:hypothetical protein